MHRLFVVFATLLTLVLLGPAIATAQDATPMASPAAGECVHPELPPGTPTPMEASPAAGMEDMEGTPEAVEEAEEVAETAEAEAASPEAEATPSRPEGTPADQATVDRVTETYENAYACVNAGDYLGFAAFFTPEALLEEFGTANHYDVPALIAEFAPPPFQLISIDTALELSDGRLYVEATYRIGSQLTRDGGYLMEQDGELLADAGTVELPADVPADAQTADAEMVDYGFNVSQTEFEAGRPIAFTAVNNGEYPHEIAVLQLPEGTTMDQVMSDPALQEQVAFYGATYAEPGQQALPLILLDLEPGTYTMICFVDVPEGVPHVARGMIAEFTVQ